MKKIYKTSILMMIAAASLLSCSKGSDKNVTPTNNITQVSGGWATNYWGGVMGDELTFSVNKTTDIATVTAISGAGYGFAAGDVIYSNIKAINDSTYSCSGSYSPDGSGNFSTRNATMSLQNNNTQLTVYYPELNASYPAITYIYQKSDVTVIAL